MYCSAAVPGVWDSRTPVLVLRVSTTTAPVDGSKDCVGLDYTTAAAVVVVVPPDVGVAVTGAGATGALAVDCAENVGLTAWLAVVVIEFMLMAPSALYAANEIVGGNVADRLRAE